MRCATAAAAGPGAFLFLGCQPQVSFAAHAQVLSS